PERHRVGSKQRTVILDMLRGRAKVTASQGDGSEHAQGARGQRVESQLVGGGEAGRCGGCVETSGGELDLGAQDGGSGRLHAATGRLYLLGRTDDRVRLIEAAYVSEHLGQPEAQVGPAELAVRAGAEAATRSVDGIPYEIESGGQPPLVPSVEREDRLRRHEGRVIMSVGRRHDRFGTFTCPREVTERGEGPESNRLGGHFEPVDEIRICERNFDLGHRIRGPATRRESRRPEPRQRGGLLGEGGPGPCDSSPGPTVRQDPIMAGGNETARGQGLAERGQYVVERVPHHLREIPRELHQAGTRCNIFALPGLSARMYPELAETSTSSTLTALSGLVRRLSEHDYAAGQQRTARSPPSKDGKRRHGNVTRL
ncbi:MAG: hypothetical protein QOG36_1469, partial [Actinomycetota bacterium]|nr:hypothetical protein [Actinomycetota bacterium]